MKIFITGSNGLLGQKLIKVIQENNPKVEIIGVSKGVNRLIDLSKFTYYAVDITDQGKLTFVLKKERPDVVIHTAAITNVDHCESNKDLCWQVNVKAVEYLVKACQQIHAHLIHLSTDFVFDGKNGPYHEEDNAKPLSYYGKSKLASEEIVRLSTCSWSIVRTVLVYGFGESLSRSNIVLWAKAALQKKQNISVVNDQFRTPTLAEDLAKGCLKIATLKKEGVFHLSGKDHMSILELVHRLAAFYNFNTDQVTSVSSAQLNEAAKRPLVTGFIIEKAIRELNYSPRSFEEGLSIIRSQMK